MIIVLRPEVEMQQAEIILKKIEDKGLKPLCMPGIERIVLGAIGDERILQSLNLEADPAVEELRPILSKYKLVSKEFHSHEKIVKIGSTKFGGGHLGIIAGPCGIETLVQALDSAEYINETGVTCFRAGIFKPRTSPYSFQGLGLEGLSILNEIKKQYNMSIVSEVIETKDIELIYEHVDAYQIGARNMQNYRLLEAMGKTNKPVVLKRGMSATVEEFLLAAEYIYNAGNDQIILCERGIRTFETTTRNTLDLNSVAYIKEKSQLPIIVDPSHGTGVRNLVNPLTKAAIAVGADGIIVETHPNPEVALSDGKQSLYPQQFKQLIREISQISTIFGKTL
ncbi:MAG: 3-deoxy-7-phosphoheptulonate synthase [Halobacteriovoraceae bacterium]|nr:3-deoxy-7-phosphoheptulonate synthase [Halobacteriovoraceae bacterium]